MARLQVSLHSEVLGMATSVVVLIPETRLPETRRMPRPTVRNGAGEARGIRRPALSPVRPPTVLYLLHGLGDDETAWTRWTSIERYVDGRDLAVVMPTVHRGYYTDQATGYDWFRYVSEELPALVTGMFRVSPEASETFVAGLSMGGYGAMKWALRRPDSIAGAAALSGGLDATGREQTPEWRATFGSRERAAACGDDLIDLIATTEASACPPLFQWCGTEDQNLAENLRFRDAAIDAGLPLEYSDGPGAHDWGTWDREIVAVLDWIDALRAARP
ncbi:esterase family protein [Agromyces intestinalis]|uniref:Esterase family protein n=1 Tax=Agromyces intestinalis TaxID=2592652 RepID=A0A5C1YEG0_9MICO|nr:alpha/beta hydrolase family protein [Agromyces intestinalis]QEO14434.1 esterase family protein [Agromyces intestinalis]